MINETFDAATTDGVRISGAIHRAVTPDGSSAGCVVVAHPHPLYGGDMWNPVVDTVCRAALGVGWTAVRFDFRGVGDSGGRHDGGPGEVRDIEAVIDLATALVPTARLVLAGYSFGAITALGVPHERIERWLAIAPPLGDENPAAAADPRPKHLLVPAHDQFCPPDRAERASKWIATEIDVVPSADHFLNGRLSWITNAVERILSISP